RAGIWIRRSRSNFVTTRHATTLPIMPIRFSCPHCSQKLSVSTRKAGKTANCPRCKKELTVPAPEASALSGGEAASTSEEGENEDDPYAQFVVYDETEL